jgi:hypothetical protein
MPHDVLAAAHLRSSQIVFFRLRKGKHIYYIMNYAGLSRQYHNVQKHEMLCVLSFTLPGAGNFEDSATAVVRGGSLDA